MSTMQEVADRYGVTIIDWSSDGYHSDADGWEHQRWTFELGYSRNGNDYRLTVPFRTGTGWDTVPTVVDILDAIVSDSRAGEEDFEDFADNFGLDHDSRRAFSTWEACVEQRRKLYDFCYSEAMWEDLLSADPE